MFARASFLNVRGIDVVCRFGRFAEWVRRIEENESGLDPFSKGYEKFGLNSCPGGGQVYREWAPAARSLSLVGDFSKYFRRMNGAHRPKVPVGARTPHQKHRSGIREHVSVTRIFALNRTNGRTQT